MDAGCLSELVFCSTAAQGSAHVPDRTPCHRVLACPLSTAVSLRSVAMAGLQVVLYGCSAEWLALRCAHGSPPDGCWDSGGHRAEKSHQATVPGLCTEKMKHASAAGDTGQTFLHLHHAPTLCTPHSSLSSSLSSPTPFFPPSFYKAKLHGQPARI